MRQRIALLFALLLAPSAAAAEQVHVTYTGDAYAVTFVDSAPAPLVTWDGGEGFATRVTQPSGDDDPLYRAYLPARDLTYHLGERSFTLAAPPARDATTRIVYVADMGTDANASAIVAAIQRAQPDLVLVGGDLSYANGNASVWNDWFELIEPLAASVPVMPAYGNHEDYCESPDRQLKHCGPEPNGWRAHFALPNGDKLYYGFEWGPVRFSVLDTEAYEAANATTDKEEQEAFLDARLANESDAWDVVVFHRPLRTTNAKIGLESDRVRNALEPLVDGRADLVLSAHTHAYERSAAVGNETLYITSGGGGRSLYDEWDAEEPWLAERASAFHFLLIEASPTRLDIQALRPDGLLLDRVALERNAPLQPPPTPTPTPTATTPPATTSTPPPAVPSNATPTTNGSGALSESSEVPGPGVLLVAALVTLSARLTRRRARE